LKEATQQRVFAETRSYRVCKSYLAEVLFLNAYDYNMCLKRFKYVVLGCADEHRGDTREVSLNDRELVQRMMTLDVQDTSITNRWIADMHTRFQRHNRASEPHRYLTADVAKRICRELENDPGHVIAFFIHANWLPGSAEARLTLVEMAYLAKDKSRQEGRDYLGAFRTPLTLCYLG